MTRQLRVQAGSEGSSASFDVFPAMVEVWQFLPQIHNWQIHETAACLGAVIFGGIHAETGDRTEGIEFLPPNHLTGAAMGQPVNSGRWLWEIA
jgi:hypothetical protein